MLAISVKNLIKLPTTLISSILRTESKVLHTLVNSKVGENGSASSTCPLRPVSVCQCRDLHLGEPAAGKYHDLIKRKSKVKKKMSMLRARLERLDKEDRPTGCILCPMRNDITVDYKNVRLLSQFVSPHTGRIYGSAVTGLCAKKQKEIARAIRRARNLGYMPVTMKYFEFHNDPAIF